MLGCSSNKCKCCDCPCSRSGAELAEDTIGDIVKHKPQITYTTNRTHKNGKKAPDGIEIRFGETRPTAEVRERLKAANFKFSDRQKIWYAIDSAKSRAFAEELENSEVDVDNAKYEKLNFWAKVKSFKEYEKFFNKTEFQVRSQPPAYYYSKAQLQKGQAVASLIGAGLLYFKKHYNKLVDDEQANDPQEPGKEPSKNGDEIADKLQALAEGMQKQIDAKLNSAIGRQRPTARRQRIAAGMRNEGYKLQETQTMLFALANAHRNKLIRGFPTLSKVRTRAQVEAIKFYNDAMTAGWQYSSIMDYFNRNLSLFTPLGIESDVEWSGASRQLHALAKSHNPVQAHQDRAKEQQLRELEIELLSAKIPGFFPTPPNMVQRLLDLADLHDFNTMLEPSAGKGDILDALKARIGSDNAKLDAIEINHKLREILKLKGYNVVANDFLSYDEKKYDRVIMNPPFENGQDIDHVTHALNLLKPNGRLVAVMGEGAFFRQFKKDKAFRELLVKMNAYQSEPIKEAFKNGFMSTGVAVRVIAMNKDGSPINLNKSNNKHMNEDDTELLEMEAQAELELLKMRVEQQRRNKKNGKGLSGIDPHKLQMFRQAAWARQQKDNVLDFK